MPTKLNPYFNFRNNTRQAMEFYKNVFGGKLTMSTFAEYHAPVAPGEETLIMHAQLDVDNGMTLMASDTPTGMEYNPGTNIGVSLSGDDENELRGYYQKLIPGGTVTMPLEKAPWGDTFGMLTDQFGVNWMVNIAAAKM